jgi:hypothetical protein
VKDPTRLREDTTDGDAAAQEVARLLRAETALVPPREWRERVREAVFRSVEPLTSRTGARRGRLRRLWIPMLALAGAAAGASMTGVAWWASSPASREAHRVDGPAAPPVAASPARVESVAPVPSVPSVLEPIPSTSTDAPAPHATAVHHWGTKRVAKETPEDAALVLGALEALRAGDPVHAGALVDEYLHRLPAGPLAEEARGVAVDAAVARADGSAPQLARQYLEHHPRGRFAGRALDALNAGGTR